MILSEFVWDLAIGGDLDRAFMDHVQVGKTGVCRECGLTFPCGTREVADQALALLHRQLALGHGLPPPG